MLRGVLLLTAALATASANHRPNIILILTDDQDMVLGGSTPLTQARKLIGDEGVTFTNAFATTPICCPSRSSILTGLYLHSHGTVNNSHSGGCCDLSWRSRHEPNTFAAILRRNGYRTFYSGKYLNTYGKTRTGGVEHIPVGWDWWVGLVGNSVYYNYTLSVNGTGVWRGDDDSDYLTDVLREYSLEFLKGGRQAPFLMVIAPPAPHEPFTPAKRHKGTFAGLKAPRTPSFNLPVNGTKHWLLTLPPEVLPPETVGKIDETFRNRWESLLAVDELIQSVVHRLTELGELNNTYIILTSDHGFHLGQFGQPWDKRQPYETDIRIPLMVRGPETVRRTCENPVLNVDLAATILDMAELPVKKFGDGRSFLRDVNTVPDSFDRNFLLEYKGEGGERSECYNDPNVKLCSPELSCKCFDARNNTFVCVRRLSSTTDDLYCEFEKFEEYYDLLEDPHQIRNRAGGVDATVQRRILDCCRRMIRQKAPVDECLSGKPEPR